MMTHSSAAKPEVTMSRVIVTWPIAMLDSYYKASPKKKLTYVVVDGMTLFNPREYREGCTAR